MAHLPQQVCTCNASALALMNAKLVYSRILKRALHVTLQRAWATIKRQATFAVTAEHS
jgi:hypothetical protein